MQETSPNPLAHLAKTVTPSDPRTYPLPPVLRAAPPRAAALEQQVKMLATSATLAWVGGYLDAFTFVGHGRVFANAMTGNVVLLGADAISGSWRRSLTHILPILMFLIGVAAAKAILHTRARRWLRYSEFAVLSIEIVIFFALGWLPKATPDFVLTMSIAFVASMQMATFREINGRSFSSTFTTGNLRTMIENAFDWLFAGRQQSHLSAAGDFAVICSMFLFGALVGAFATPRLHNHALWIDTAVLSLVLLSLVRAMRTPAA